MNNNEDKKCIFCDKMCEHQRFPSKSQDFYRCDEHGEYTLTDFTNLHSEKDISIVSGYLFEMRNRTSEIILTKDEVERIKNDSIVPKTAMQKLNKIMKFIYSWDEGFGAIFSGLPHM